jgi:hypothetical protein
MDNLEKIYLNGLIWLLISLSILQTGRKRIAVIYLAIILFVLKLTPTVKIWAKQNKNIYQNCMLIFGGMLLLIGIIRIVQLWGV